MVCSGHSVHASTWTQLQFQNNLSPSSQCMDYALNIASTLNNSHVTSRILKMIHAIAPYVFQSMGFLPFDASYGEPSWLWDYRARLGLCGYPWWHFPVVVSY